MSPLSGVVYQLYPNVLRWHHMMQSAGDGRSLGAMGSRLAWELSRPGDISRQAGVPLAC